MGMVFGASMHRGVCTAHVSAHQGNNGVLASDGAAAALRRTVTQRHEKQCRSVISSQKGPFICDLLRSQGYTSCG